MSARETAPRPRGAVLTRQQKRAMLAFLWNAGRRGFDDEACDGSVWDWGVRPWPTMDNLTDKGLVAPTYWMGGEGRWYRLTDAGREYMAAVVASRAERSVLRAPAGSSGSEGEA